MEIIESDVVIIGGGPAGCTCALYTSRSNLKTVILDKNPSVGALAITHQIATIKTLAKTKSLYSKHPCKWTTSSLSR